MVVLLEKRKTKSCIKMVKKCKTKAQMSLPAKLKDEIKIKEKENER